MLDGYPVSLGDSVFVMGLGTGTVTSVNTDGGFTVKTGTSESYFRDGGYIGNQKRVYWADPYIITPPKNRRLWRAFVGLAVVVYEKVNTIFQLGGHEDAEEPVEKS